MSSLLYNVSALDKMDWDLEPKVRVATLRTNK
jgi:hypothetical protein